MSFEYLLKTSTKKILFLLCLASFPTLAFSDKSNSEMLMLGAQTIGAFKCSIISEGAAWHSQAHDFSSEMERLLEFGHKQGMLFYSKYGLETKQTLDNGMFTPLQLLFNIKRTPKQEDSFTLGRLYQYLENKIESEIEDDRSKVVSMYDESNCYLIGK
ncbi:hypothetical protein WN093_12920 [Gammaproteobacteria bacterium AS21]